MSEKKLLNFIITEGVLLLCLGLGMLLIPKLTPISFANALCFSFLVYGLYKTINGILIRNYAGYFMMNIISGLILFVTGFIILFSAFFDIFPITSLTGLYFITESLTTSAFAFRGRSLLRLRASAFILSLFQLFLGMFVILCIPPSAIWVAGLFAGIDFLLSGVILINIYYGTVYRY